MSLAEATLDSSNNGKNIDHNSTSEASQTQELEPSKDCIYSQPYRREDISLTDLAKLEKELPSTSSGFYLVDVGVILRSAPKLPLKRGTLQLQSFSKKITGILTLRQKLKGNSLLGWSRETFDVP